MPGKSWPAAAATIEVAAPVRLHFGLLAPAAGPKRRYGGLGVMIRPPELRLRLEPAPAYQLPAQKELARRIDAVVQRTAQQLHLPEAPPLRFCLPEPVPLHAGLGTGTQLAMAVAWALQSWLAGKPVTRNPGQLAGWSGRGQRSAVGVYGFCHGGWIVEPGKGPGEHLSPLEHRLENPPAWRWLLLRPPLPPGRAGAEEQRIFQTLRPTPRITRQLQVILHQQLLPALQSGCFDSTAQALGRYSRIAGEPFAQAQGGPYAHPLVQQLVEQLHGWGYAGAGQSSWGPTVFVLLPDVRCAQELQRRLQACWPQPLHPWVAATDTAGAQMCLAAQ